MAKVNKQQQDRFAEIQKSYTDDSQMETSQLSFTPQSTPKKNSLYGPPQLDLSWDLDEEIEIDDMLEKSVQTLAPDE